MKNIPGTLLHVRRLKRKKDGGFYPGVVLANDKKGNLFYIPYGESCLLLSYNLNTSRTERKFYNLEILWNKQTLNLTLTNNQCNKWFCGYEQWAKYHEKKYNEFIINGEMKKIWTLYNVNYRINS